MVWLSSKSRMEAARLEEEKLEDAGATSNLLEAASTTWALEMEVEGAAGITLFGGGYRNIYEKVFSFLN